MQQKVKALTVGFPDSHFNINALASIPDRIYLYPVALNQLLTLETSYIGFEPKQLNIESYASYNIKIFHNKNELIDKELHNGEVYVYEIEDLTEELITMRPERSSERFRKYQKTK